MVGVGAALAMAAVGTVNAAATPEPQMKAVIDQLVSMGGKPIEKLSAPEARQQPTPADAVGVLLKKKGKAVPEAVARVVDRTVPGPSGPIPVRVYTPAGAGPHPLLVYIHGGGWVIATMKTYDSSPRALANLAKCVVVSLEYRKGPEHRFPAAHEDSYAATQYIMHHASAFGADPKHVAICGESAGGNLASAVCMMARDRHGTMPVYQVLVYPITNYGFDTPSYIENANAKPLNKPMMQWFFQKYLRTPADGANPYVSILRSPNLKGLPPATVITAQIDPLRSEGKAYADRLRSSGIPVVYKNYTGVTHEFFGMGAVEEKARAAEQLAAQGLRTAFSK